MSNNAPASVLLHAIAEIARHAGAAILEIYSQDFAVERKADASPLTEADLAAQRVIMAGLKALDPSVPVLSEEARAASWVERQHWSRYWLVDPLDGTREFVKRNGEFTVNIALIQDHEPVLGVVLAPVTGELYAAARHQGAWLQTAEAAPWQSLHTRKLAEPAVAAGSRSHGADAQSMLEALLDGEYQPLPMGSSLKFCLIARGDADIYLRLGATSEWDTAAAQCVLEEAGGALLNLAGDALRYNTRESVINPEFLAVGDTAVDWSARLRRATAKQG
jgi:3'(2'), 5'-bisphosphate nucleotidase